MPGQQNFGLGGDWGDRTDQLRLMQAEEDINRRQRMAGNQLRFNSGRQGLNEGAMGANLARLAGQGQRDYGQFRRGLAINAGQEQERRLAQLLAACHHAGARAQKIDRRGDLGRALRSHFRCFARNDHPGRRFLGIYFARRHFRYHRRDCDGGDKRH
jgi:hypothetical protein